MTQEQLFWYSPAGKVFDIYIDMLKQPHLLIAGASGSGKSVLINSLIYSALYKPPTECMFILIDPKRVELVDYKESPHCISYASEPQDIENAINQAVDIMETRYKRMQAARIKKSTEADIYVIVDEFADLMTTQKKETLPPLQRLAQLGRAANVHLILATQRPTKDIVSGQIKVNMDSRVALRCPTAQDSRNILDHSGAEQLPAVGFGYYLTPQTIKPKLIKIHLTPPEELNERVEWWTTQAEILNRKQQAQSL